MQDEVLRLISAIFNDEISRIFGWAIVFVFIGAIGALWWAKAKNSMLIPLVANAPSIMTSVGILGTFFGIFLGLLDFDISEINKSLPQLLDGLKIAFGSSIMGLTGAVLFRLIRSVIPNKASQEDPGLLEISDQFGKLSKELEQIKHESMLSNAQFSHFQRSFDQFSDDLSKTFSQALIEELRSVIREFNEKMGEQLGENFAKFNEALEKLLKWQESYKQQLQELSGFYDDALKGINVAITDLRDIAISASVFSEHIQKLNNTVDNFATSERELSDKLETFSNIKEKAEEAFPVIQEMIEVSMQSMLNTSEQFSGLGELTEKTIKELKEQMIRSLEESREDQQLIIEQTREAFATAVGEARQEMQDAVKTMDEGIREHINQILTEMAQNMSGITQHLVNDFEGLVAAFKELRAELKETRDNV